MCISSALLHVESGFVINKANYFSFSQEDKLDKRRNLREYNSRDFILLVFPWEKASLGLGQKDKKHGFTWRSVHLSFK